MTRMAGCLGTIGRQIGDPEYLDLHQGRPFDSVLGATGLQCRWISTSCGDTRNGGHGTGSPHAGVLVSGFIRVNRGYSLLHAGAGHPGNLNV